MRVWDDKDDRFLKNVEEMAKLLDLIDAEFRSDPMSTACFDRRIVDRVRQCVAAHKEIVHG